VRSQYPPGAEIASGVYIIWVERQGPVSVYCNMPREGGGWTVVQRRSRSDSTSFYRPWTDYEQGFGDRNGSYWIGNTWLAALTFQKEYVLRVELIYTSGHRRHAEYTRFIVGGSETDYTLVSLGYYSGDAGDPLSEHHVGRPFSTYDRDHDSSSYRNCAAEHRGGWWYTDDRCFTANLNAESPRGDSLDGVYWPSHHPLGPLQLVEMLIRPRF
jgi:hypothetical protein